MRDQTLVRLAHEEAAHRAAADVAHALGKHGTAAHHTARADGIRHVLDTQYPDRGRRAYGGDGHAAIVPIADPAGVRRDDTGAVQSLRVIDPVGPTTAEYFAQPLVDELAEALWSVLRQHAGADGCRCQVCKAGRAALAAVGWRDRTCRPALAKNGGAT